MYEFIEGTIEELNPSYVVLNTNGTGYFINITVTTYSSLKSPGRVRLFTHFIVREDAHLLFGFYTAKEREIFRHLISVSGIGANTSRLVLSSLSGDEVVQAIVTGNVTLLTNIKGIGAKTAQRMIIELKDKFGKTVISEDFLFPANNTIKEEALSALVMLGFAKAASEKVLNKILMENPKLSVEGLVKESLKAL